MAEHPHYRKNKLHSEEASEQIRPDDLLKATQIETKKNTKTNTEPLKDIPVSNTNYWRFKGEHHQNGLPKGIKWGIGGLVALFVIGSIVSVYAIRHNVAATISTQVATLQQGVNDLQNFDTSSATQEFASIAQSGSPGGIFGAISQLFQGGSGAIKSFTDLSTNLAALSQDLGNAQNDFFTVVAPLLSPSSTAQQTGTSAFVNDLTNINTALTAISNDTNQLSSEAAYFGGQSEFNGTDYLSLKTQVQSAQSFLSGFIPWLSDTSTTHHILVLLQNPSEMRPGGGFIGSYADLAIGNGVIKSISVHDVADVDKAFTQKIIPPPPLQLEGAAFRPADGNWFFDFPTSASETLSLFNESGLYAGLTTFEGAIAITPQVLSDLLSVTGPVTVSSTQFTSDNLVVQIQKIVQAGQAKSAGAVGGSTYPKGILSTLWSSLFDQLASSTSDQKSQMLNLALTWISNRDVMMYFSNSTFQTFASGNGATGAVYQLPKNVNSDYLAVVNADINSDKSELYVSQNINYDAIINPDGTLDNHIDITRIHNGKQSPYWWYQTTNQDYLQVFVPDGSSLTNENGGIVKSVPAPINYTKNGYSTDPLILAIQSSTQQNFTYPKLSTQEQFGKEVFDIWTRVYEGSSTTVSLDYTQQLPTTPADGVQYQFVFEHQAGSQQNDTYEIDAPIGYMFAENQLSSFIYKSAGATTPGSMVVNLTLEKIP